MSVNLPSRAVKMIREYSKPMTHPEWRKSNPIMTTYRLFKAALIRDILFVNPNLFEVLLDNIKETEWFKMYHNIVLFGVDQTSIDFNTTHKDILKIEGMHDARLYNHYNATHHL